jgi:hypothetical protein
VDRVQLRSTRQQLQNFLRPDSARDLDGQLSSPPPQPPRSRPPPPLRGPPPPARPRPPPPLGRPRCPAANPRLQLGSPSPRRASRTLSRAPPHRSRSDSRDVTTGDSSPTTVTGGRLVDSVAEHSATDGVPCLIRVVSTNARLHQRGTLVAQRGTSCSQNASTGFADKRWRGQTIAAMTGARLWAF